MWQGAGRYSGSCCELKPFCAQHWNCEGDVFYLVRVGGDGCTEADFLEGGVRVLDSWSLGIIEGAVTDVALMVLLNRRIARARGNGDGELENGDVSVESLYG